jgi:ribonucleoside-diphosphate reductase alpha chain
MDIIKLAGQRQEFIDMGQSINLMIHPDTPAKEVIKIHLSAFDEGLKSLYYQFSINAAQKFSQKQLECSSCEG